LDISKDKRAMTVFSLPWRDGVRGRGIKLIFTLTLTLSHQGRGKSGRLVEGEGKRVDLKVCPSDQQEEKVSLMY
jgi:hypothetical protein